MRRIHPPFRTADPMALGPRSPLTHDGQTRSIEEWACDLPVSAKAIVARLRRGLDPSEALKAGRAVARSSLSAIEAGRHVGRLRVLGRDSTTGKHGVWARVLCECGREFSVRASFLQDGHARSCGCYRRDRIVAQSMTHGMTCTPEHLLWLTIIIRCENVTHLSYRYYGAKGIRVCERWRLSFENFLADVGPRPSPKHLLRRINPAGHYEPGNVAWSTRRWRSSDYATPLTPAASTGETSHASDPSHAPPP